MKFKKLLLEKNRKDKLKRLLNERYQVFNTLLVRGTNYNVQHFEEKEIRKDRKPVDTGEKEDVIVSAIEDAYYPNVPKRQRSKFAATESKEEEVIQYGENIYYCFPHKDADVVSLPKDAITYFRGYMSFDLRHLLKNFEYQKLPATMGFVEEYQNATSISAGVNQLYNYVRRNWKDIVEEMRSIEFDKEKLETDSKSLDVLFDVKEYISDIHEYFDSMKEGVRDPSPEVIFDGPKYLLVNKSYKDFLRKF